ncbi:cytochrome P450 4C1 [Aedes albopictus]|uniref:Cytochrome P450 n=1 Tax=Aedes albopictus TaxID=7160 RepID=A0ABM1YAZ9_AEDAL
MLQLLLVFVLITGVTYYLTIRRSRKRLFELMGTYPGPFDLPLIGSTYIGIGLNSRTVVEYLLKFLHTLPSPFRAWIGPYATLLFDQPKHLAVILNSQKLVQKSFFQKFFRFDKGVINADHVLWRMLRKRLGPPFSKQVVSDFVPTFNEQADGQLEYLDRFVGSEAVDMLPKMSVYALSSTLVNLFQVKLHAKDYDFCEKFAENSEKMWIHMFRRVYKPWIIPEFLYRLTPSYKVELQQVAKLRALSKEIVQAREVLRGKTPPSNNDCTNTEILIDRLERLTYGTGELDYATMMDNIDTFLFASVDTTSSTVASTLLMMAMHPEVQERVYREVAQVIPAGDYVALEDLPKLAYLDQVIKETMRLIPVATILNRVCTEELQVDDQWTIPMGAIVGIPVIKIHRDRRIWGERSEEFDPDHFLPERCAQRHPYAYIPFSAGIRNCIGMRYAMISMKVVLVKMVKRFRFRTDLKMSDLKFEAAFLLMLANKHMVQIERR